MGMIKCAMCGKEVERTGSRQIYCSDCAYKALQERQKARRHYKHKHITKTKIIKCVVCGQEVEVNARGGRAKYCETCASMAYSDAKARSNAKRRKEASVVCCVCGEVKDRGFISKPKQDSRPKHVSTLAEMIAAAKAAGMSYGQYKTMLAMKGG